MATSVWKGHLTFGLVSIPVKLYRAARAETIGFRQIHEATGTRVRQTLCREAGPPVVASAWDKLTSQPKMALTSSLGRLPETLAGREAAATVAAVPFPGQIEVRREELAKGYEYEPGRYVVLSRQEMEDITPRTAYEMQILEFVKLAEVDPIYFETSYYVAPDRAGERACALLFQALRTSGFVAIAQVAMHRREHVVVIRPGRTGIVLHTMFYEPEIRRQDEYRTDATKVSDKELELALLLVNNLAALFDPTKYRDSYREKLDALLSAKLKDMPASESKVPKRAPVVNILEALERSLQSTSRGNTTNPVSEEKLGRKRSRAKVHTTTEPSVS